MILTTSYNHFSLYIAVHANYNQLQQSFSPSTYTASPPQCLPLRPSPPLRHSPALPISSLITTNTLATHCRYLRPLAVMQQREIKLNTERIG